MQIFQAMPTFVADLLLIFLGFLVVHNQYKRINLLFLYFVVVDAVWLTSVYAVNFTSFDSDVLLGRAVFALSVGLVVGAFSFIDALLHFYRGHILRRVIYVYSVLVFGLTLFTPLIVKGVGIKDHARFSETYPIYGPLYLLFLIYVILAVGAIFAPILRAKASHGASSAVTAQQLTYVRSGIALFALLSLATNLLLPIFFGHSWTPLFTPVGSLVLASSFFVAIGRYKLFDIRFVAIRAAAYLTTLFIITFAFIAPFVWAISHLIGSKIDAGQFAIIVASSVSLLYLLLYIRKIFDRITAKIFFRNDYDPQDVQDKLSDILVRTADLEVLLKSTATVLQEALRSSYVSYVLLTEQNKQNTELAKRMHEWSIENKQNVIIVDELSSKDHAFSKMLREKNMMLAIKLHTTHEDMGFMILGHKQSGELYGNRDIRMLSVAADEIAISLQNVLRFEQIQRFNETLQEEVDNATRKLRQQNKRLEELDNIKDDFISMASHQLRTPLTSVKGYISMVVEGDAGKLNSTQTQMLKQAFASSQRMVFLITDLLNVSRLKTGKFIIEKAPTKLDEVIAQELDQLRETAQVKNITLAYDKPKSFPALMLDEVKTRQIIMNFVDNAIYYTPAGGHIKVELIDKPSIVECRVTDDGIGVPKSEQHHLFTKFYRATNARKARPDGTGLGLFMAQKVILAQGGSVIFSSVENKGSTFGFSFSKSRLAVPAAPAKNAAAKAPLSVKEPANTK